VLGLPPLAGRGGPARGAAPRCKRTHAAAAVARNDTPGGVTVQGIVARLCTTVLRFAVALTPFATGALVALVMRGLGT